MSAAKLKERRLAPSWEAIQTVWDEVAGFFRGHGLGPDQTHALSMTAHELLENAVKYGRFETGDEIVLRLTAEGRDFTVEVRNRATDDETKLHALDQSIQWIRGFANPFDAYVERLKLLAAQPFNPAVSGLGLLRIAYEAQCVLDFYVDGDELALSAVYRAGGPNA